MCNRNYWRIYLDILGYIIDKLLILPGVIIGMTFHEFGHAIVSYKLGDPTPKSQNRLSLNPIAHTDPIGLIALIFFGFGWGKPVRIDPRYYRHKRRDELLVAVAGVIMNLLVAIAAAAVLKLYITFFAGFAYTNIGAIILQIIIGIVQINLVLMVFNLIPVPPLDGFSVITQIFDLERKPWYYNFYHIGPMILLIMIVLRVTSLIISPCVNFMYSLLLNIFQL